MESKNSTTNKTPKMRKDTKLAKVVEMLKSPEGATITQIVEVTSWKKHTARGTLSNLKRKYGFEISSASFDKGNRVYRIATLKAE